MLLKDLLSPSHDSAACDVAFSLEEGVARIAVRRTSGEIVRSDVPLGADAARQWIRAQGPRSRRAAIGLPRSRTFVRAVPLPPGVLEPSAEWLESATRGAFDSAPALRGVFVMGDRERPIGLCFAARRADVMESARWARTLGLNPIACRPAWSCGANLALQSHGAAAIVVDLFDPGTLTLSAVAGGKILLIRTIEHRDSEADQLLQEARRTISYVRERHRGLKIDRMLFCGSGEQAAAELMSDGLAPLARSAPAGAMETLLEPFDPSLGAFDLLPPSERNVAQRRWLLAGLAGATAVVSTIMVSLLNEMRVLEADLQSYTLLFRQDHFSDPELDRRYAELQELRKRATDCAALLERARGPQPASAVRHLLESLESLPKAARLTQARSDGKILVVRGYCVSDSSDVNSAVEWYASRLGAALGDLEPKLEVSASPVEASLLGADYASRRRRAEQFSLAVSQTP
ncbi:MAG: hypothetical protein JNJ88_21475 [Planctomycetes bacterium]|nr:hypothetical protein [Planctomycetota bacterium]